MLQIVNKGGQFIRADYQYDSEIEIALDTERPEGFYQPLWNGESWEESATQEYIGILKTQAEPSLEERIQALEVMELERILGGGF